MEAKIKIKIGKIEVEFEGSEAYLKAELPTLIEAIFELYNPEIEIESPEAEELIQETGDAAKRKVKLTTNSIATKLDVKSGPDLILAACVHMHFSKGAETFTRANILAEMREASNFFKSSYVKNLSQYLKSLMASKKIIERSKDTYALESSTVKEMEKKIEEK